VTLTTRDGAQMQVANDAVFAMIGREPPLDFFRASGVRIQGEWRVRSWLTLALVLLVFGFVYHWKKGGLWLPLHEQFQQRGWFPFNVPDRWAALGGVFGDPQSMLGTLRVSLGEPGFYYSTAYCLAVVLF